ncbi:MAG TPA: recombinase family protein [candidate division Zixibacteria bacterium]
MTTSAGRLMLNVLMSFAQFEREIIAERTSDKMCAARRKGKWCGGPPVLGYDIDHERKRLIINPDEAEQVREVFDLYLEKQSMLQVVCEINRRGWTTKSYQTKAGSHHPGALWDKSKLQRILTNVTYIGKTRHQGQIIDAEHEGIVDPAIFEQVQELIRENGNGSGGTVRNKHGALLKGILKCGQCGAAMAHTYTKKGNRLYRYYTCTTYQKQGPDACTTRSLAAQEIEDFVVEQIRRLARDPDLIREVFEESIRQRQEQLARLESERNRLVKQRQQKGEEIKRLVSAIAGTPNPSPSLTERLAVVERQAGDVDLRLQEIDTQTSTLRDQSIDLAGVTAALEEFEAVWGVMCCAEREQLVHALSGVIWVGKSQNAIEIGFRSRDAS